MTFASQLRVVMRRRRMPIAALAAEAGVHPSVIHSARSGRSVPLPVNVAALARVLDAPELVRVATASRTVTCAECGTSFMRGVQEYGRFCRSVCRKRYHARVLAERRKAAEPQKVRSLQAENGFLRLHLAEERKRLESVRAAVDAMCRSCEPEGMCRMAACDLRAVSPLRLADSRVRVA